MRKLEKRIRYGSTCSLLLWLAALNPSIQAQTVPNAPTNLLATAVSTNQINLSWTDNSGNEDGFKIERAPDSGGSPGAWLQVAIVSSNVTAYSNVGLTPFTTYWYRVRAYNSGGDSDYSAPTSATTPCPILVTITAQPVSQTVCSGSIVQFSVAASGGSFSYQWRKDGVNLADNALFSGANTPMLTVSNVSNAATTCGAVAAGSPTGVAFMDTLAGHTYYYYASGCVGLNVGCGDSPCTMVDPNGNLCSGAFYGGPTNYICPSLTAFSLVGKIGDACVQLGETGSFVAPSSGTLVLYCNDYDNGDNSGAWQVCVGSGSEGLYDVVVSAVCNVQTSSTATLTVTTPPLAPSALTATAVFSNQINLSWTDNANNEDGFYIERAPDNGGSPGTWTQIATVSSNVTASSDTGLAANATYWYRVRAFNTCGDSLYCNQASATIAPPPNAAPSGLTATAVSANEIDLSWTDNSSNEDGFIIDRAPDNGGRAGTWAQIATVSTNITTYSDVGLAPLTTYWYRVRAYTTGGASDYSNQTNALTPTVTAPSGLTATAVSTNQINLSWTDNSNNEDGFYIERAPDNGGVPGAWTQIAAVGANVTTYSDTGAATNTKYWYRVRAYNAGGNSGYSNQASATTPLLMAPSGLTATAVSTNQVNLSWLDNSSNEDGFDIERAPDNGGSPGTWAQIATVGANVTTYSDTGLSINTKYWYRVRAYNAGGNSDYSNQASDTTLPLPPQAPSILTATTASGSQINLSWADNSSNEDGFKIERSTDGTHFAQIAQVLPNTTTYRNTGLALGTTYFYRVRAYNRGGSSGFSNVANATTLTSCSSSAVFAWGYYSFTNVPPGLANVVAIAAGYQHSLALRSTGTVVDWGYNGYSLTNVPTSVTNAVAIADGGLHGLALRSSGTVVGWGYNSYGQTNVPASVTNAVAIAAGYYHSLALKSDGTVVGWGNALIPPPGLTNVVAIAAGNSYSLALKGDGTVVGWGDNSYGKSTPPAGLTNAVAIAAGFQHSLGLRSDGTVVGWGESYNGETNVPPGVAGVAAIGAGNSFSLVLMCHPGTPSALVATAVSASRIDLNWVGNSFGDSFKIERAPESDGFPGPWTQIAQVLGSTTTYRNTGLAPGTTYYYRVRACNAGGNSDFSNVANASTPALCATSVAGWGNNNAGQATPPSALTGLVAIAAGFQHGLGLKSDGTVVGWGNNSNGQTNVPASVTHAVAIAAGGFHSLALKSNGTVIGWGNNLYGQTNSPASLTNAIAIAAGYYHSLALKSDGTVIAWGDNSGGQTNLPPGLGGVVAISAGFRHNLALRSDGTVVAWGYNIFGLTNVPVSVTNAVAIAAGRYVSLALKNNGTVVAWGNYGPPPPSVTNVVAIAAYDSSLALNSDGTVVSWGGGPTPSAGLSGVASIAVGGGYSLAMTCAPNAPSARRRHRQI